MAIQFKKNYPEAFPSNYTKTIRMSAKVRWYCIVLLISIPLIFLLYSITTQYIFVRFSGLVTYDTITLRAPDAGYIKKLNVRVGEKIDKNNVLLQFVSPEAQIKLKFLQKEKIRLTELSESLNDQNETALSNILDVAKQDIESSKAIHERFKAYVNKGNMAELQLEEARRNYVIAQRTYATLVQQINDSRLQNKTLVDVNYRRKILEIENNIAALESMMRHFTIYADKPGTIMHIATHNGEFVSAGQTLLTLVTQKNLNIVAFIEPKFLNKIYMGKQVDIVFPGNEKIRGHIINTPSYAEKIPASQMNPLATRENKLIAIIKPDTTVPQNYRIFGIPVVIKLA